MNHALFLSTTPRRGQWLKLRKPRRNTTMAQPLRGSERSLPTKVYCDPRMPDGWAQITD